MPVLAPTATATRELVQSLTDRLRMVAPLLITAPTHRQNLLYEVRRPCSNDRATSIQHSYRDTSLHVPCVTPQFEHCPPADRPSRVRAWVEQRGLQSSRGLVFATTRKAAEEAATALCGHGLKAAPYH